MKDVGDQLSSYLAAVDGNCSLSDDCKEVNCELSAVLLSLNLSCSPVGVRIEIARTSVSPPKVESHLITDTGVLFKIINVIVHQKSTEAFRLFMWVDGEFEYLQPVVNDTYIPITSCEDKNSKDDSPNGECLL